MINNVISPLKIKTHAKKPNQYKYAFIVRPSSYSTLFFKTHIPFLSPKPQARGKYFCSTSDTSQTNNGFKLLNFTDGFFSNFLRNTLSAVFTRQLVIKSQLYIPYGEYMSYFRGPI